MTKEMAKDKEEQNVQGHGRKYGVVQDQIMVAHKAKKNRVGQENSSAQSKIKQ